MSKASIYLEALEYQYLNDDPYTFSCNVVQNIGGSEARHSYADIFDLKNGKNLQKLWFTFSTETRHNWRLTALAFAHSMAKAGDL
jgi:hypothetical protein